MEDGPPPTPLNSQFFRFAAIRDFCKLFLFGSVRHMEERNYQDAWDKQSALSHLTCKSSLEIQTASLTDSLSFTVSSDSRTSVEEDLLLVIGMLTLMVWKQARGCIRHGLALSHEQWENVCTYWFLLEKKERNQNKRNEKERPLMFQGGMEQSAVGLAPILYHAYCLDWSMLGTPDTL